MASSQRMHYNTFESPNSSSNDLKSVAINIPEYETYNTNFAFPVSTAALESSGTPSGQDTLICCLRCKKMYKDSENNEDACKYHYGAYKDATTGYSMGSYTNAKRWSCCKSPNKTAEGCATGRHMEDQRMTTILNTFNINLDENSTTTPATISRSSSSSSNPTSPNLQKKNSAQKLIHLDSDSEDDLDVSPTPNSSSLSPAAFSAVQSPLPNATETYRHEIQKSDTLVGLALKYNVKTEDIKKANKLFGNDIASRKFLTIPPANKQ